MATHIDVRVKAEFYNRRTGKLVGGSLCMFEGTKEEIEKHFERDEEARVVAISDSVVEYMQYLARLGWRRSYIAFLKATFSDEYETDEEETFFAFLPRNNDEE